MKNRLNRFHGLACCIAFGSVGLHAGSVRAEETPCDCKTALKTTQPEAYADAALFEAQDCGARNIFCIDPTGFPVPQEQQNPKLWPGEAVTVKLFVPPECGSLLTLRTDEEQREAKLFRTSVPSNGARVLETPSPLDVLKTTFTPDTSTDSMTIYVARKDASQSLKGITLSVAVPKYYLDVGVLAAFVPYRQKVSSSRIPGLTDMTIREENELHPSAAISLNVFPCGQLDYPALSGWHGLGIQVAIGGDLDRLDDEFYLGMIYEVVPGAGLSGGLALTEVERLQPGHVPGTLVDPEDIPKDTELAPRFYFGISLNAQIFQTVLNIGSDARVPR